jgi:hypothetical protein
LIWLKNANCFAPKTWANALELPELVTLEYFPKCNISSENIDILLFFSYIQLTAKNSHRKKLTAGIVAEIDC